MQDTMRRGRVWSDMTQDVIQTVSVWSNSKKKQVKLKDERCIRFFPAKPMQIVATDIFALLPKMAK